MFSGKSAELAELATRRLIGHQEPGKDFLTFNHHSDTRYGNEVIAAHNGKQVEATPIKHSHQLLDILFQNLPSNAANITLEHIRPELFNLKAIYIDEGQFFDQDLPVILELIDYVFIQRPENQPPLDIRIAGLDTDFRGEPFSPMPALMAKAEQINKHQAVCTHPDCGQLNATRTQRLIDNAPAGYHDPIIKVGAQEDYTARCQKHHQVPEKPLPKI